MANTGDGKFPFKSTWLRRTRSGRNGRFAVLYETPLPGASDASDVTVFNDWFFEASVAGAISGSADVVFSTSGTLTGAGALAGATSPAFATAGTLRGTGALSGAVSFAFAASATGQLIGALAGSSDFAFAPAGSLTGAGALSGSTSFAFTNSGTLVGTAALSGASSFDFAPAGTLTGTGALTGSSDFAFTLTGTLDGAADGAMVGSTSITFTVSGTLTGIEAPAEPSTAVPVASGGSGRRSAPPRHLTEFAFRNDPPAIERKDAPEAPAHPALGGGADASLSASPPLSPEAVEALSAALVGGEVAFSSPPVPLGAIELQAGNDDEEALIMILALAA